MVKVINEKDALEKDRHFRGLFYFYTNQKRINSPWGLPGGQRPPAVA